MLVLQVQMLWTCPATSWNGTYPMHRVADGQPLYEADVSTGLECPAPADGGPTIVTVQVRLSALRMRSCKVAARTRYLWASDPRIAQSKRSNMLSLAVGIKSKCERCTSHSIQCHQLQASLPAYPEPAPLPKSLVS